MLHEVHLAFVMFLSVIADDQHQNLGSRQYLRRGTSTLVIGLLRGQ